MTLEAGTTIGRYQILGTLGHGGMASVYKAFQPALERVVALKVLRPAYAHDPEFLERFRREALAIARLRHPHIVQVHDFDEAAGLVFLVMEHIEGGTLKQKLVQLQAQGSGLPWGETARIVGEVAEALAHAHAQGIVHRDVKPSNVMLTRDGRAVVTDFGIAKILAAAGQTQTGVGVGTPEYMSPEQGQAAPVDHRSDVYSLGVMAYELLTGRVPYLADTPLAVMLAHVRDPLPLPSKIDPRIGPRIEQVLLRVLAKDPAARYQSATELGAALASAIAAEERGGTIPTVVPRAAARRGTAAVTFLPPRLPGRVLLSAALAATIIGAASVAVLSRPGFAPASPGGTPASASAVPTLRKGALLYEAKLDGAGSELRRPFFVQGDPSAVAITPRDGALELAILKAGGNGGVTFDRQLPASLVAEAELAFRPGSTGSLRWIVHSGETGNLQLRVLPANEELEFAYFDSGAQRLNRIGAAVPLPGTSQGRRVTLTMVQTPPRYAVFVDGAFAAEYTSDRFIEVQSVRSFVGIAGPIGTAATLTALRAYALPEGAATAPATAVPTATVKATSPPTFRKGPLLWDARLDAPGVDFTPRYVIGEASASEVRFKPAALELAILQPKDNTGTTTVKRAAPTYAAELQLRATPGSDLSFWWVVRTGTDDEKKNYQFEVDALSQTVRFTKFADDAASEVLVPKVPIAGFQTGRGVTLAVVAGERSFALFLDGTQFGEAPRTGSVAPTPFSIAAFGAGGTVTVTGLRAYLPPVDHAAPRKGALLYEAKLDGAPGDIRQPRYVKGDPTATEIRFPVGAIEFTRVKDDPNAVTDGAFNAPARASYIVELDLSVPAAFTSAFYLVIRDVSSDVNDSVSFDLGREAMFLNRFDAAKQAGEPLTPRVSVPGMRSGRPFTVAVVVEPERYTLFLDEQQVAEATGFAPSDRPQVPHMGIGCCGVGSFRVVGARVYERP